VTSAVNAERLREQAVLVAKTFLGTTADFRVEDRPIIESAMNLWSSLVSENLAQLDFDFITRGLLTCKDSKVRECFQTSLVQVVKTQPGFMAGVIEFAMKTLDRIKDFGTTTKEFFVLCKELCAIETNDHKMDLLLKAITTLKAYKTFENKQSLVGDFTLQGLLNLIASILKSAEKDEVLKPKVTALFEDTDFVSELFYRCLFYQQGKSDAYTGLSGARSVCCVKESRRAGFNVLMAYLPFLAPKEMIGFLEEYIAPLLREVERPARWRHSPSTKARVEDHAGITNLGCICYMISMLQQFFMVPQFRYQLLRAVDETPPQIEEYNGDKIDDNLLRQLQSLFGYLELTERHAANPKALCFAYKDYDGTPTKTGEQKDSQEFLNIFFERLESLLKPTS